MLRWLLRSGLPFCADCETKKRPPKPQPAENAPLQQGHDDPGSPQAARVLALQRIPPEGCRRLCALGAAVGVAGVVGTAAGHGPPPEFTPLTPAGAGRAVRVSPAPQRRACAPAGAARRCVLHGRVPGERPTPLRKQVRCGVFEVCRRRGQVPERRRRNCIRTRLPGVRLRHRPPPAASTKPRRRHCVATDDARAPPAPPEACAARIFQIRNRCFPWSC